MRADFGHFSKFPLLNINRAEMCVLLRISEVVFCQMVQAGGESGSWQMPWLRLLTVSWALFSSCHVWHRSAISSPFIPFSLLPFIPVTHPHVLAPLEGTSQPRPVHLGPDLLNLPPRLKWIQSLSHKHIGYIPTHTHTQLPEQAWLNMAL